VSDEKSLFIQFLNDLGLADQEAALHHFERYLDLLMEMNKRLNLFSRSTQEGELWTKHFLDSLLPLKCLDFSGKKVLDFGSGGGLPGIPVKLAVPACRMTLLDATRKKTVALEEMVAALELEGCDAVCGRLEELRWSPGSFDLVLCRAVRMEERYLRPLHAMLKPGGKVLFYKAKELEDIAPLDPKLLIGMDFAYGHRAIHCLEREQLKH
jgi:16S rRNA (guanine527-N7)-methyltransferase